MKTKKTKPAALSRKKDSSANSSLFPIVGIGASAGGLEALEQLRALWYDYRIHVAEAMAEMEGGVDTEEDLARVEALLRRRGSDGNRIKTD